MPLDPAREPTTRTAVRWADDENNSAELRKLRAARAALADDPYRRVALHDEFEALRELGRWDEARITLARLIEFDPQDTDLRFAQACVLLRLSRWLHAIDALQAVVRAQPEHARAWYNLATAHQRLGRLREARHAWDRVVTLTPEAPDAFAHRGEILLDLREWAAAAEDFRAASNRDPEATDLAINLALALRKLNRLDEARDSLMKVIHRNPRHVPTLNGLAELAWEACAGATDANEQHRRAAISWWRRSLAVDPQQPTIETLLANAQKH
ncbi:MAG: tetratricopeptide repeat protein [Planctomycetes bacterium]|nr:tetratricopeptide repeat protein [Planctomycetota bacterium]